jgi:cell division protein FtsZ
MKDIINTAPKIRITVVGVGGCGCNTINMLYENGLSSQVNLIAVNTDLASLNSLQVENKILIGENLTNGYGAGSNPEVGLKAAEESKDLLKNAIKKSDLVIITAGFGGGTGTGASPFIARITRDLNIKCLAILTLPFESEGKLRMDFALQGIADIKDPTHAYITLSNDLLLKGLGKSVGLFTAFNHSNEVLNNLLISLVQMLTETGYVNVDKNDFFSILSYEGESILGVGKAETQDLAFEALEQALNNPLVSIAKIDTAKGIIFQLFCKSEPKLATYNGLIDHIREKIINKSVLIVPGVTLDPNLASEIEILIVASGIDSISSAVNNSNLLNSTVDDSLKNNFPYDQVVPKNDEEQSYTDIPAITRKKRT